MIRPSSATIPPPRTPAERTLAILRALLDAMQPVSRRDLAARAGVGERTVYREIATLRRYFAVETIGDCYSILPSPRRPR
jgi:predicted DNA-binding transcriptional regulator YafY